MLSRLALLSIFLALPAFANGFFPETGRLLVSAGTCLQTEGGCWLEFVPRFSRPYRVTLGSPIARVYQCNCIDVPDRPHRCR